MKISDFKVGQKLYAVNERRNKAFYATIKKVGRKYLYFDGYAVGQAWVKNNQLATNDYALYDSKEEYEAKKLTREIISAILDNFRYGLRSEIPLENVIEASKLLGVDISDIINTNTQTDE